MRRNPEMALYRVTLAHGGQAEVEAKDKAMLKTFIKRSDIIDARYVGSTGGFTWLLNAGFIVTAIKEEPRVSPSDESATSD